MLVYASDEAKEDRYYHKTLEEIDGLSLVRDRTGRLDEEEEEEEEGEGEAEAEAEREEDQSPAGASPGAAEAGQRRKSGRVEPLEAEKTTRQKEMDEEWGLYRDDNGKERGASSHRRRGGGGGSDSEGELDQAEEEDYAVSPASLQHRFSSLQHRFFFYAHHSLPSLAATSAKSFVLAGIYRYRGEEIGNVVMLMRSDIVRVGKR